MVACHNRLLPVVSRQKVGNMEIKMKREGLEKRNRNYYFHRFSFFSFQFLRLYEVFSIRSIFSYACELSVENQNNSHYSKLNSSRVQPCEHLSCAAVILYHLPTVADLNFFLVSKNEARHSGRNEKKYQQKRINPLWLEKLRFFMTTNEPQMGVECAKYPEGCYISGWRAPYKMYSHQV